MESGGGLCTDATVMGIVALIVTAWLWQRMRGEPLVESLYFQQNPGRGIGIVNE